MNKETALKWYYDILKVCVEFMYKLYSVDEMDLKDFKDLTSAIIDDINEEIKGELN